MAGPRCPLCGAELIKKGKRWYCPSCGRSWYICRYCGEVFENQRSLAAHIRSHKRERVASAADIVFEYARGRIGLGEDDRVRFVKMAEELGGKLEPGAAAAVALSIVLYEKAGRGAPASPKVEKQRQARVEAGASQPPKPAPQPPVSRAAEGGEREGLPSFAKGNPWLKALGGRGAKG